MMGEMEQNTDLLTSSSFSYSVVLIKHGYVPATEDTRVNKRRKNPVFINRIF